MILLYEKVNPASYIFDGKINKTDFRRFASPREQFWIDTLKTHFPSGFNCMNAIKKIIRRPKAPRPRRWEEYQNNITYRK